MRCEAGFTLIESLIALLILSGSLAIMIQGVNIAMRQIIVADERRDALVQAQGGFAIDRGKLEIEQRVTSSSLQLGEGASFPIELEINTRHVGRKNDNKSIIVLKSVRTKNE